MSGREPVMLEYGARPSWTRRRGVRRILYGVAVLAVVVSGWWWVPPVKQRVELLYWQRRCMNLSLEGRVVFERMPAKAAALMASDPGSYRSRGPYAEYESREWDEFYRRVSPPGQQTAITVFVHEMTRKDGERRLVAVHAYLPLFSTFEGMSWNARVFDPGSVFRAPRELGQPFSGWTELLQAKPMPWAARVMGGGLDPADASHATVRFQYMSGVEGFVDLWLGNDDTVTMKVR